MSKVWQSPIRAGDLRHRITVRRRGDVADGKGGYDVAWSSVETDIAANVTSLNGREAVIGDVLQGISVFQIVVRYGYDVQPSDQILWGDRELNVVNAEDRDGRKKWLYIQATTEAPQGA